MFNTLLNTPGVSFYAIPAAWISVFLPFFQKRNMLVNLKHMHYDNVVPRRNADAFKRDTVLPKEFVATCAKLEGAHQNGLETFPVFVAAVLAGNVASLDTRTLNIASISYVLARLAYNYAYVNAKTDGQGFARTGAWVTSLGICFYVLVKAGKALRP
ncbi:hypothetical protein EXIGLDRAFT_764516 [Exidia glandulosa HHB12029]|uniref:Membrane-associated proteins in eicosanoid and glutathione metabolism n=1 Tax=Exidia glandulosa HHB12029 TaxID=1314781 RepID=A0A165L5U7_EXIGL|nr:hypothetical protein EXIGLDRAFT_764516 [Exidia glandulosa HHB12029]